MRGRIGVALGLMLGVIALSGPASAIAGGSVACTTPLDDFSRPDGTNLGPNWTERAFDIGLLGGVATNTAETPALMTFNGQAASEACVSVRANPTPASASYVAIVLGYAGVDDNVFVKVQDNNQDGSFDKAFFYRGNNGDPWSDTWEFALTPFSTGNIHLTLNDGSARLDIDRDLDDVTDQSAVSIDLPPQGLGSGIGLGLYGGAQADAFEMTDHLAPQTRKGAKKLNRAKRKAKFSFASDDSGASFRCRIDKKPFAKCTSPRRLRNLRPGRHKFRVTAVDRVGNRDLTPIVWKFKV